MIKMVITREKVVSSVRKLQKCSPLDANYRKCLEQTIYCEFGLTKDNLSDAQVHEVRREAAYLARKIKDKYDNHQRKFDRMMEKNQDFFDTAIILSFIIDQQKPSSVFAPMESVGADSSGDCCAPPPPLSSVGAKTAFGSKSSSQQFRVAQNLRQSTEAPALLFAASQSLKRMGHKNAAKIVSEIQKNPENLEMEPGLKKILNNESHEPKNTSIAEALSIVLDRGYTQRQYLDYSQDINKAAGCKMMPRYKSLSIYDWTK